MFPKWCRKGSTGNVCGDDEETFEVSERYNY